VNIGSTVAELTNERRSSGTKF